MSSDALFLRQPPHTYYVSCYSASLNKIEDAESLRMQLNLYISPSTAGPTTQTGEIIHSFCILLTSLCGSSKTNISFINTESLHSDDFIHLPLAEGLVVAEKSTTKASKTISIKRDVFNFSVFPHILKQRIYEGAEVNR